MQPVADHCWRNCMARGLRTRRARTFRCHGPLMGLSGRSPLQTQHQHTIKSAGCDKPTHRIACCEKLTPLRADPECPQWVGSRRSRPEERGSANRTRAVGGVKSVSRFELQGKIRGAICGAQTGVNPGGEPLTARLARGVEPKNPSASFHKSPSKTVTTLTQAQAKGWRRM